MVVFPLFPPSLFFFFHRSFHSHVPLPTLIAPPTLHLYPSPIPRLLSPPSLPTLRCLPPLALSSAILRPHYTHRPLYRDVFFLRRGARAAKSRANSPFFHLTTLTFLFTFPLHRTLSLSLLMKSNLLYSLLCFSSLFLQTPTSTESRLEDTSSPPFF